MRWTQEQEDFINQNYLYLTDENLATALGVDTVNLTKKRQRMGLRKQSGTNSIVAKLIIWADIEDFDKRIAKLGIVV